MTHSFRVPDAPFVRRVLDCLTEGVVLVGGDGVVHCNAAAERLLANGGDALAADVRFVATHALHGARVAERLHTAPVGGARLRVRATRLPSDDLDADAVPLVAVTIDRVSAKMPSRAVAMRQFSLTPREASVALLVAEGRSNAELAAALHLSESTGRHYTESVFLKLGVHTRAAAAAVLLGTETRPASNRRLTDSA